MQNYKYERKQIGKDIVIIPNELTHLEKSPKEYCNKETFEKEFAKMKFKAKEDLSEDDLNRLANILLEAYLNNFDPDGWLILEKDGYEKFIKDV